MKTFDLLWNGNIVLRNRSMEFCMRMKNKLIREGKHQKNLFTIQYNGTTTN